MKFAPKPKFFLKSHLYGSAVKEAGENLHFPDSWDDLQIVKFVTDCDAECKTFDGGIVKNYEPTTTDIALVKSLMRNPKHKVEDFGFYMIYASNTLLDLQNDKVTKELLDELAPQYKALTGISAKSALINHRPDSFAGASFDAMVAPMENSVDQWVLWVKVYVPNMLTFQGNVVKDLIDTGCMFRASVQFRPGKVTHQEVGDKFISVLDADANNRALAIEISWAYHGAVMDAMAKDLGAPKIVITDLPNMAEFKKTLEFGDGALKKTFHVTVQPGENPAVVGLDAVEVYTKALVEENVGLRKASHDSKKPLVDGIVGLQKKLKQPEDTEDYLHSLGYDQLDARKKVLEAQDSKINPKNQTTKPDAGDGVETKPEDSGKSVFQKMLDEEDAD